MTREDFIEAVKEMAAHYPVPVAAERRAKELIDVWDSFACGRNPTSPVSADRYAEGWRAGVEAAVRYGKAKMLGLTSLYAEDFDNMAQSLAAPPAALTCTCVRGPTSVVPSPSCPLHGYRAAAPWCECPIEPHPRSERCCSRCVDLPKEGTP